MDKLIKIQSQLKAPKGQRNSFGNYNYRSCEDILQAVKPLLSHVNCQLTLSDEIVEVGGRVYVKATATITDAEGKIQYYTTAYAREADTKKGMDVAQITGAASSYARKYALNGLFAIDDGNDPDKDDNRNIQPDKKTESVKVEIPAGAMQKALTACEGVGITFDDTSKNIYLNATGEKAVKMLNDLRAAYKKATDSQK